MVHLTLFHVNINISICLTNWRALQNLSSTIKHIGEPCLTSYRRLIQCYSLYEKTFDVELLHALIEKSLKKTKFKKTLLRKTILTFKCFDFSTCEY
jgi:hypothetical protein